MAWVPYDLYKKALLDPTLAAIDHNSSVFRIMLLDNGHSLGRATHDFVDDVVADEVTGTNYARIELTSPTVSGPVANVITWDATEPATPHWATSGAGFSDARYAILFAFITDDASSPLIAYHDFTTDKGNVTGDLSIQLDALGIATL